MITIKKLPVPPSLNASYKIVRIYSRAKGKAVNTLGNTAELTRFKNDVRDYFIVQKEDLAPVAADLKEWIKKKDHFLRFEAIYSLPREKFYFKNGKPRRLDASNRLKAIEDAVSKGLGIDDSVFISSGITKRIGDNHEIEVRIFKGEVIAL